MREKRNADELTDYRQIREPFLSSMALQCTQARATGRVIAGMGAAVHGLTLDNEEQQRVVRAIVHAAQQAKSRITLCAWEERRKFVHVHAPFKTSPFPDRDVHYMHRYFAYFAKTAGTQRTS